MIAIEELLLAQIEQTTLLNTIVYQFKHSPQLQLWHRKQQLCVPLKRSVFALSCVKTSKQIEPTVCVCSLVI